MPSKISSEDYCVLYAIKLVKQKNNTTIYSWTSRITPKKNYPDKKRKYFKYYEINYSLGSDENNQSRPDFNNGGGTGGTGGTGNTSGGGSGKPDFGDYSDNSGGSGKPDYSDYSNGNSGKPDYSDYSDSGSGKADYGFGDDTEYEDNDEDFFG